MKETLRAIERPTNILSFGSIEDLVADLKDDPPEKRIVRIDTSLKDGKASRYGIGLRVASVLVTAKRQDELLVANFITSYVQTLNGRAFKEEDGRLADENNLNARRIIEEQLEEAGLTIRPGAYSLPEDLVLYRSTCARIVFKEKRVIARKEAGEGAGGKQ